MSIEIKVPVLPESVSEATIASWHKKVGDYIRQDENLVDIETEKVVLEVPSTVDGVITEIKHQEGDIVEAQQLLAIIKEGTQIESHSSESAAPAAKTTAPQTKTNSDTSNKYGPAVHKLLKENNLDASQIIATGKNGILTKADVQKHLQQSTTKTATPTTVAPSPKPNTTSPTTNTKNGERTERREPMSRLRTTIARRLKEAQNTQAMLTTFNDVNLQAVMNLRAQYKEKFEKAHGARLGFMSFFIKASIEALKRYPTVNASIDGNDIVHHDYYDIGIAAASPRGLVVPVLRDVDQLSFAQIEQTIANYGQRAKEGKLGMEELTGGTFTITNGGVFGSMLSTPIVNPPQSAILGMHRIEQRPIAENDEVVIRPMMYLALTYDHRIIDGAEAVRFLVTIKECLEDPARLLLEI